MRTSIAIENDLICPKCGDGLNCDWQGLGYVCHIKNNVCQYGTGKHSEFPKDTNPKILRANANYFVELKNLKENFEW